MRKVWGGVYFCTEWIEEKKRRKSLWGVGLSKAGAGKNLHQLLLWFDKNALSFALKCTENNRLSKSRANYCRCFRDETRGHLAATLRCPKLPANTAKSSECLNCRLIKLKNHAFKFPYSEFLL